PQQALRRFHDSPGCYKSLKRGIWRRGHVEFIYAALKKVPEFGVERNLIVYNKLLDVFPKEVFVPRNFIQCMFNHYPRQQECGVHLLEQMENYGVSCQMSRLKVQIFRDKIHPMRKYQRLPGDLVDLASLSLNRHLMQHSIILLLNQIPLTQPGGVLFHCPIEEQMIVPLSSNQMGWCIVAKCCGSHAS
uniref:ECSIT signaling integrator n=1 Tax=Oncorhynchus tshawytscha TaxID=74940 RepID=A0A8C8F7E1_ONCTS